MHKSDHRHITRFAIDEFAKMCTPQFRAFLEEHGNHLVKGSGVEDNSLSRQRLKNWHFYKPEKSENFKPFKFCFLGTIEPSSRPRYEELIRKFQQQHPPSSPSRFFNTAGRILHHIQDMSTPSHVLPIFHSPVSFWKEYPKRGDCFEDFSKDVIKNHLGTDEVKEPDGEVNSSFKGFMALYDFCAGETFKYLAGSDSKIIGKDSEGVATPITNAIFWEKLSADDAVKKGLLPGWGDYGPHEKDFGSPLSFKVDTAFTEGSKDIHVNLDGYIHIYNRLLANMVSNSLTALRMVEQLYRNPVDKPSLGEGDIYP